MTLPSAAASLTSANAGTFAAFTALAARAGASTRVGPILDVTATPGTLQDLGCVGVGGGPATFVLSLQTGTASGAATYSNFDRCFSMRVNGTANVTGTLIGTTRMGAFTLAFADLAYPPGGAGDLVHASGTILLDWQAVGSPSRYLMTIDATVSDANRNTLFKLDHFQIDSELAAGLENVLISGRLTTAQGFVDVASTSRLELPFPGAGLQNGSLTMTGAGEIASVRYNGTLAPDVTIAPKP